MPKLTKSNDGRTDGLTLNVEKLGFLKTMMHSMFLNFIFYTFEQFEVSCVNQIFDIFVGQSFVAKIIGYILT